MRHLLTEGSVFLRCGGLPRLWKRRLFDGSGKFVTHMTDQLMKDIEAKWGPEIKREVQDAQKRITDPDRKKYVLSMFPYPSGQLHMGHVRVYSISDVMAHYYRMNGFKVFHPMGWDAFGLPAENAAIERGVKPKDWTKDNIAAMKGQMKELGLLFDWDAELATCDPAYYKWTQWLFLKMLEGGLAYRRDAVVNWDPVDQTVLADEQVDGEGRSWRSGAKVEKRPLKQWFLKTTAFAGRLSDGLDSLPAADWRDIIAIQRNWIGDCDGVNFDFGLEDGSSLTVWTKHPEFVPHGVAFIGVCKGHIVDSSGSDLPERLEATAANPFGGAKIPVFAFPEGSRLFPDGATSFAAVPEADGLHAEAARCLRLEAPAKVWDEASDAFRTGDGFDGLTRREARERAIAHAVERGLGGHRTSSRLQDWLVSRQRYWGTPIPVVHCRSCGGPVAVDEKDLPVELPPLDVVPSKGRHSLLAANTEWTETTCPRCGGPAERETDTMDTFLDSSWYFLRYLDPRNDEEMVSASKAAGAMPVDLYVGGKEHATLHMYYARFVCHFLESIGVSPVKEPFEHLLVQGMVKGRSYQVRGSGEYVGASEVEEGGHVEKGTGRPVAVKWEKMSKSKRNGVDPGEVLEKYGMDMTRLLILSDVSPLSDRLWDPEDSHKRISNMASRLLRLVAAAIDRQQKLHEIPHVDGERVRRECEKIWDARNFYVRGANQAYATTRNLSMVMARVQGLIGELTATHGYVKATSAEYQRGLADAIILLAPLAPHFCADLWEGLGKVPTRLSDLHDLDASVFRQPWPRLDPTYNLKMVVRKNDADAAEVPVAVWKLAEMTEEEAFHLACGVEEVQRSILPKGVKGRTFEKDGYGAVLRLEVEEEVVGEEERERLRLAKKEKRLVKAKKREERIAAIQAAAAAKGAKQSGT